jgi:hypothetical protein
MPDVVAPEINRVIKISFFNRTSRIFCCLKWTLSTLLYLSSFILSRKKINSAIELIALIESHLKSKPPHLPRKTAKSSANTPSTSINSAISSKMPFSTSSAGGALPPAMLKTLFPSSPPSRSGASLSGLKLSWALCKAA